jgi:hypothetical protein
MVFAVVQESLQACYALTVVLPVSSQFAARITILNCL